MSENRVGKVIQVTGPVLDIRFKEGELPDLHNAIEIMIEDRRLIAEVAQQVGDDVVTSTIEPITFSFCPSR